MIGVSARQLRHARRTSSYIAKALFWFMGMVSMTASVIVISSCSGSADPIQKVRRENVSLVPPVEAGEGGWCLIIESKACRGGKTLQGPIMVEAWSGYGSPPINTGVVITTGAVPAISVEGGPPVATRVEGVLPYGLRAAVVEIQGGRNVRRAPGFNILVPAPMSFVPLGQNGKPMYQDRRSGAPLIFTQPTQQWTWPVVPNSVCEILTRRHQGLRVVRGAFVTYLKDRAGLVERPLLSCAITVYQFNGSTILANVLVDAGHPGSRPGPLPGMKTLQGHPRIVDAVDAEGDAVAEHIPHGWLIVSKGANTRQRLALLAHLRAVIHL